MAFLYGIGNVMKYMEVRIVSLSDWYRRFMSNKDTPMKLVMFLVGLLVVCMLAFLINTERI